MSMSQIFDILHKMDINWSIIKEYLNKEDQMLADNSRYVKRKMILLSFVQNLEKLISIYTSVHNSISHMCCSAQRFHLIPPLTIYSMQPFEAHRFMKDAFN